MVQNEDRTQTERVLSFRSILQLVWCAGFLAGFVTPASAQSRSEGTTEIAKYALKLPEKELLRIDPRFSRLPVMNRFPASGLIEGTGSVVSERNSLMTGSGDYPWKMGITATVFWVGELATANNPMSNDKSAWDTDWIASYGGTDSPNPEDRAKFLPLTFVPRQNPFYVALPYNDVDDHHTKLEAVQVIPWFNNAFMRDGQSVCKGRWVAIRHGRKICYAQWEDVGPFQTDDWQYVFGGERPRPNSNRDAGLDVSPAVREYLGMGGIDVCDWKFVEFLQVPIGPWAFYGENNTFSRLRRLRPTPIVVSRPESPSF